MVQLTERAVGKVREILDTQEPKPAGLRIAVVGGGCSGFSYSMIDAVHQAIEAGNASTLRLAAHKLKGSIANFSAHDAHGLHSEGGILFTPELKKG